MEKKKKQAKKKGSKLRKYSQAKVIKAIEGTGGIITEIATRLGCQRATVYAYLDAFPKIKAAYDEERTSVTEMARANLIEAIFNNDVEISKWWVERRDPEFTAKQQVQADVKTSGGVLVVPGVATDASVWEDAAKAQQAEAVKGGNAG
jgi:transposase